MTFFFYTVFIRPVLKIMSCISSWTSIVRAERSWHCSLQNKSLIGDWAIRAAGLWQIKLFWGKKNASERTCMSERLRQKWLTNNVRVWIRRRTAGRCVCVCVCLHIILPCLSMNEWTLWMASSCSAVIPGRLHRYHSWHFGLRYLPTAPWETDGRGRLSGHVPPPQQALFPPVNHNAALPETAPAPLFHTTWPTPPTNAAPRPRPLPILIWTSPSRHPSLHLLTTEGKKKGCAYSQRDNKKAS